MCNRTLNGPVRSTRTHSYSNTSDAMVKWENVTAASYIDNRQQCNVNVNHSVSREKEITCLRVVGKKRGAANNQECTR